MNLYVNNNGEVLPQSGPTIKTGNRGHLYGDGVFETVRVVNGKPINFEVHFNRMIEGAEKIKMRIPGYYSPAFFEEKIIQLLQKSGISMGGRVRIHLDRAIGGTYKPETNEPEYLIEVYPLESNNFELNQKGLEVDIYSALKKDRNYLSNYKVKNGLIYVVASIDATEKGLDDYLICNSTGGILEGTASNLFIVSNGVLYTPGLEEGCLAGTMRMQVINLAIENGIKVYECNILPQNLLAADELFLTNAISGIQWIQGYRTKRYFNSMSRKFIELLNEKWIK